LAGVIGGAGGCFISRPIASPPERTMSAASITNPTNISNGVTVMIPQLAHVAERHRRWVAGFILIVVVRFPYGRWFLLVILNLPGAIAVGAVLTITYPAAAITMRTDLHCRLLSIVTSLKSADREQLLSPGRPAVRGFCLRRSQMAPEA
jgi:hypothetical protein